MSHKSDLPPEVFVSYSHKDSEYKEHLVQQLDVLAEQKIISQWHDGLLVAGERWNDEIVKRLKSSRVILLLISVDFLTSVYVNDVEIKEASRRYHAGEVTVIPVLVRNVHGWKEKPFGSMKLGDLQALPSNSKFIKGGGDLDDAFADVAEGIQKAVEKLKPTSKTLISPPSIPTSNQTDYVKRHDEQGRDILERLHEGLAPGKKGPIALWGKGGMGKTRIAAEAASALAEEFSQRIVWASAEKRTDFTFSTLLDEIARQLGEPEVLKLAQEPKEEVVRGLLAQAPALVVLDNFETVASEAERASCVDFLAERANCPSLITSRQKVAAPARNIPIKGMSTKEAQEFVDQLVEQTQDSGIFRKQVRSRIIKTSESNPYIMLWMVAQIDEAQTPKNVLDELEQGKGSVAERVFDRSFTLQQVGEDGRAVLLALSLFVPDASREALAEIAGLAGDLSRVDEAARNLRMLWLIGASEENERLSVEGLTRSQTSTRLSKDARSNEYHQKFVKHFLGYTNDHGQATAEDYGALELEKDNVLKAMDVAFDLNDWTSVWTIARVFAEPVTGVLSVHGYWGEATRRNEQALAAARRSASEESIAFFTHNLAVMRSSLGELDEVGRLYNESLEINKRLGNQGGIAITLHQLALLAQNQGELDEARRLYHESLEIAKKLSDQGGIASTLHQLAILAQGQGELDEARRLYHESLEIAETLGDQSGIAITLHQLALLAQNQGELDEARRLYHNSLEIAEKLGNQGSIAITLHQLARLAQDQGELDEARRLYHESLEIAKKLSDQGGVASTLHQLATLAQDQGELDEARRLYNESLEINKRLGNQGVVASTLHQLALLAHDQGELDEAQRLYNESLEINKRLGNQGGIAITLNNLASLAQVQGELDEARRLYNESLEINKRLGNQGGIAITLHELGRMAQDQGELDEARRLYHESLEIKKRLGNQGGIAISLHQLALLAQDQGELDEARRLYHESLEINKRLGNQGGIAITLGQLGRLAEDEGHNAEAAQLFGEALAIFEKLKSPNAEIARRDLERVKGKSS